MYKVALIQLHPQPGQIEHNYAQAVAFIRQAATDESDLAVLTDSIWAICLVPGSFLEKHQHQDAQKWILMDVTYFIDKSGQIAGRYAKKNPWHPERPFTSGSKHDAHVAFNTPLGKVGLLICWDLAFPDAFRELVSQGAKIIVLPPFWTVTSRPKRRPHTNP
ncbi:uncharacterized protein PV06_11434 [Exophiala oligosperma]|uniref:CN hydrolase domain-containing protein n=1 Tax=Exophiala oligosperma TaxID=215243 RepID=A0A0D2D222_9EURO|nr:uncharacterized protein PV06_11434 [Exophiala oligosperma]KIW36285.1 hypothetical protein PV06_11434 [Exophiala oligosperma]